MKRAISIILILAMILSLAGVAYADSTGTWKKDSKGWWYKNADGTYPADKWQKIDGKWYHFDADGYMQTGWLKDAGKWYYLNSGGIMQTGWQKIDGKWYYFKSGGDMVKGWQKIDGDWYYFNNGGDMATGWKEISGKTYYLKPSGVMAANEWCKGWWLNKNGTWTYKYKASWKKDSKGWRYEDTSGWYAKNATYTIDGKEYKFDANGYWGATEIKLPEKVSVYIPQKEGNMLDRSARIMVDYLREKCPDVKFTVFNSSGNGNDHAMIVSQAENDGSVLMFHGAGAIVQYYNGDWDYNLADQSKFIAIAAGIGQEQPSGAVTIINADETRFDSIPTIIEYIKAHPGEIRISYTPGTPHEVRIKLILNYFGIKKSDVMWVPGSASEIRAWIAGHTSTDVAIIAETVAAMDISGGKVKGICNSVPTRDLYNDDLAPLTDDPILPEIEGILPQDVDGLVCAWPMTIYGPAGMDSELVQYINDLCAGILDDADYMAQIKALGSTNTYQVFTVKQINDMQQAADRQIKTVFEVY